MTSIYPNEVYILIGDGIGSLQVEHTYTLSARALSIATGDLNGDGKLDLEIFTVDENGDWSLTVLMGNGDGTFGAPTVYQQGLSSNGPGVSPPVLIADLQGNHRPDVATIQGDSLVVFPNNGDGTFGAPVPYFAGSGSIAAVVADFNGDGKLDAAVLSSAGIGILPGNGDGTFQGATFTAIRGIL